MLKTIAILAPSSVPFQIGGAEKYWWGLRNALASHTDSHVELIKIPVRESSYEEIISAYETFSKLDLSHFDALITTKYPAWIAPHHFHICYMQHPLRGLYDTYRFTGFPEYVADPPAALSDLVTLIRKSGPTRGDLPLAFELARRALRSKSLPFSTFAFPGPLIRELVHFFDRIALDRSQIRSWLAISHTVASRKDYFPEDAQVTVLPHPPDIEGFHCKKGEYLFTASRLNGSKRIDLLIQAMKYVPQDITLKIAGTGPDEEKLKRLAADDPRIQFIGFISDRELPEYYARAIAVPFVPYDEDYGLITIEAMKSAKPVITVSDAGGVCEYVRDGENGLVAEPIAPSLGAAISRLAHDPGLCARLGEKAARSVEFINWPGTVHTLLDVAQGRKGKSGTRIVVAAPFAAEEQGTGGTRRLYNVCKFLSSEFEVIAICPGEQTLKYLETKKFSDRFTMLLFPWPDDCRREAASLAAQTGQSANDIALYRHAHRDQALIDAIREAGANAKCIVLAHPWLHDLLATALPGLPLVYDAYDVEADIKKTIFGAGALAEEAARQEGKVCRAVDLVCSCSREGLQRLDQLYQLSPKKLLLLPQGYERLPGPTGSLREKLPYRDAKLALFLGSGHAPNVEAAFEIFRIASSTPEVEFLLAGTVSTQSSVREAEKPDNVHLLGKISEKAKNLLLQVVDLAINPMISGSGVNLKAVEYIAAGIPLISTPFGMRGLPEGLEPAVTICPVEDFPEAIQQFFASPPLAEVVAAVSQKFARDFSWDRVLQPLVPAIHDLIAPEDKNAPPD